jgi:hypothetical protein
MSRDLSTLTAAEFEPLTGQTFRMTSASGLDQEVELLKVRIPAHRVPKGFRQQFALEFRAAPGQALPQGIYTFTHPGAGELEFMITPVQSSERGVCYEGVFG